MANITDHSTNSNTIYGSTTNSNIDNDDGTSSSVDSEPRGSILDFTRLLRPFFGIYVLDGGGMDAQSAGAVCFPSASGAVAISKNFFSSPWPPISLI